MFNFILGLIIGGGGVYLFSRLGSKAPNGTSIDTSAIDEDLLKKRENIAKIKSYIKDKDQFTNDDLQDLLKVSDTTIGRYLEELEHDKVIKQVGKTGQSVYYVKI